MSRREHVRFRSGEAECAGWLYLPDTAAAGPVPAIAMAHGLGAVKEFYIAPIAERIAATGLAVLLFDYRYYGESSGTPREQIVPQAQIEDYRNALTWLALHDQVDENRLGVWGTSFSGGHVLHLGAYDPRVKAVVSQVAGLDLPANARRVLPPEALTAFAQVIAAERKRRYQGGEPAYIPLAAPTGEQAMQPDTETYEWLEAAKADAPTFVNHVTVDSIERVLEHAPGLSVDRISPKPLLLILATKDKWTPPELIREAFARAGAPKRLLEIEGGHYVVYSGEGRAKAADAAAEWFAEHLGGSRASRGETDDAA